MSPQAVRYRGPVEEARLIRAKATVPRAAAAGAGPRDGVHLTYYNATQKEIK